MTRHVLRIGMAQMKVSPDRRANFSKAASLVLEAARAGAEVVCLPELFGVPYFPTRRTSEILPEAVPGHTTRFLSETAKRNRVALIGGSLYERSGVKKFNTCAVFSETGKMVGKYRKVHLPQDEHFYEQDYFSPGSGYKVVRTSFGRFGVLICFDQWYPEAARVNRLMGAQVLFYPTAIGHVIGIQETEGDWKAAWEGVQVGHAIANSVVVCAVNRVGTEAGTEFWGGSFVSDQFGRVIIRAGGDEGAYVAKCNLALGEEIEKGWSFLQTRRPSTYGPITE